MSESQHLIGRVEVMHIITLSPSSLTSWNTINNTTFLNKNLSDCEIGFQQNQNNITLQDALNNSANKE